MRKAINKADIAELRTIFCNRIEQINPDACLALSGGVDSLTVLFSMLEAGRKPDCVTFHVDGIESADLLSSRNIARAFGLNLKEIVIPNDVDTIYQDVKRIIPHCEHIKKTIIQCMHPWLYIYPEIEGRTIVTGMGGDDLYANQRKLRVSVSKYGEESIKSSRKVYSNDLRFSGANIARFGKMYDVENIDFYLCKEIEDWFLQFESLSLYKPYEKYPSVAAFRDYYDKGRFYRKHSSYQTNSKLKNVHDKLLYSKYNKRGHKAIIGLYNEMAKG